MCGQAPAHPDQNIDNIFLIYDNIAERNTGSNEFQVTMRIKVKDRSLTKKPTFAEQAYEVMKRAILKGEIPEGSFLTEEVAKRYGIGRTPFREACNRLHQQQLVDLVPRHGFLVRGISFKDVVDIFELRLMLEVASAEFAVIRGSNKEVQQLFDQTSDSVQGSGTIEKIIDANTRFHLSLARMSHNAELVRTLAGLLERYEALSYAE